ncbi:MAG: hypothetical protein MJ151_04740, partial [Lachnospiraceae bacterium]|nr:hypothetical protein [Lachnospiraceae bacterium]
AGHYDVLQYVRSITYVDNTFTDKAKVLLINQYGEYKIIVVPIKWKLKKRIKVSTRSKADEFSMRKSKLKRQMGIDKIKEIGDIEKDDNNIVKNDKKNREEKKNESATTSIIAFTGTENVDIENINEVIDDGLLDEERVSTISYVIDDSDFYEEVITDEKKEESKNIRKDYDGITDITSFDFFTVDNDALSGEVLSILNQEKDDINDENVVAIIPGFIPFVEIANRNMLGSAINVNHEVNSYHLVCGFDFFSEDISACAGHNVHNIKHGEALTPWYEAIDVASVEFREKTLSTISIIGSKFYYLKHDAGSTEYLFRSPINITEGSRLCICTNGQNVRFATTSKIFGDGAVYFCNC